MSINPLIGRPMRDVAGAPLFRYGVRIGPTARDDGGDVADVTGRYHAAGRYETVHWTDGPRGPVIDNRREFGFQFGYCQGPNIDRVLSAATFAIRLWADHKMPTYGGLIYKRFGAVVAGFTCDQDGSRLGYRWGDSGQYWAGGPTFPLSRWFTAFGVIRPDSATVGFFADDGSTGTAVELATNVPIHWDAGLQLGMDFDNARDWEGLWSDARMWDRPLGFAELQREHFDPDWRWRSRPVYFADQAPAPVEVAGAVELPALGVAGAVAASNPASGPVGLPALGVAGAVAASNPASGSIGLPALGASGSTGPAVVPVAGAVALPALGVAGAVAASNPASGSIGLPALGATGSTGPAVVPVAGSIALPGLGVSGSAGNAAGPLVVERELTRWLKSRLGRPVFTGKLPQAATRPALVWNLIGVETTTRLASRGGLQCWRVQFDAYADDIGPAAVLLLALRDELRGYSGPMGAAWVKSALEIDGGAGTYSFGAGSDATIRRRTVDYRIWFRES